MDSEQRRRRRKASRARPRLRKKFGQHHLRESSLCRPLVEALQPEGRVVVEVGPGGGVLTRALLDRGARVWALELDLEWAAFLGERERHRPQLSVVVLDAEEFDWGRLPKRSLVAGNLPFNVATRILTSVLGCHATVERAGFMVQKEVAERLVAAPGSKAYGSLSVLTHLCARVRWLAAVSPGSFVPPPKVAAAFVSLELRSPPLTTTGMQDFTRLVRAAFAYRRKTLGNNLARLWNRGQAGEILTAAGIDPRVRAESLEVDDYLLLFETARKAGLTERRESLTKFTQ